MVRHGAQYGMAAGTKAELRRQRLRILIVILRSNHELRGGDPRNR